MPFSASWRGGKMPPHITEEQFRAAREEGRPQVLRPASLHNNINFVAI